MVGVGLDLIFGPLVIQARFIKPDHIAISNAMLLFASLNHCVMLPLLIPLRLFFYSSAHSEVPSASHSASPL